MKKTKRKEKQTTLAGFIKRLRMDLNVKCNKVDGENVEIPRENNQVKKKSARVVQKCANYETLAEEQALMHILDHEANLDEQRSIKSRNYRTKWKFKYPSRIRTINVLGQSRLKCIFCEKFRRSEP